MFWLGDQPGTANNLSWCSLLDHLLSSSAVRVEESKDVDIEHPSDVVFRQIENCLHLGDAGVCNHDIQVAEILHGGFDQSFDFGELGNICGVAV